MSKMKNTLNEINSGLDTSEEKVNKLENNMAIIPLKY